MRTVNRPGTNRSRTPNQDRKDGAAVRRWRLVAPGLPRQGRQGHEVLDLPVRRPRHEDQQDRPRVRPRTPDGSCSPPHWKSASARERRAVKRACSFCRERRPRRESRTQAAAEAAQGKRVTFDQGAEAYLQKYENESKNAVHRRQWCATLRDFIAPVLGKLDVETIDTEAALRVLDPIRAKAPKTASRIRGRIESALDFADCNGSVQVHAR
jgi:hypothetical protein